MIWHDVRLVDAHGVVILYGYADDEWFYFKARFREGRVVDLFRVNEFREVYSRTCAWELEIPIDELKPAYDAEAIRHELSLLEAQHQQHFRTSSPILTTSFRINELIGGRRYVPLMQLRDGKNHILIATQTTLPRSMQNCLKLANWRYLLR